MQVMFSAAPIHLFVCFLDELLNGFPLNLDGGYKGNWWTLAEVCTLLSTTLVKLLKCMKCTKPVFQDFTGHLMD